MKSAINHISLVDLRDASTSAVSFFGADTNAPTLRTAVCGSGEESSFYSASDSSLNALSTLNEASSDSSLMPPPAAPFSYGKKYGNSTKLFVSGRRKTLKMRPKMHMSVPSMLAAGSSMGGSGRSKPLKRGSPLAVKDSLRLKKKNKLLKVEDGSGTGGGSGTKRTKARLL